MKNFNLGGAISGDNALKPQETGWEVIEGGKGDKQTTWDDLKDVAHDRFNPQNGEQTSQPSDENVENPQEAETATWGNYEELEKLESIGVKSFKIFMRPPPIEKTVGLTDGEWRQVQARFDSPDEWHPERVKFHEQIITTMLAKADALSQRLREHEIDEGRKPTIYCLRGTCGSGKTTALRGGLFNGILDETGEPSGTLAPDVLKTPLREDGKMSHVQVHDESSMLSRKLSRAMRERAMQEPYSMVYDKLMAYPTDFEDVFEDAAETDREVAILDMDVPLELSAVRVLSRTKGGEDPILNFNGVANAFSAVRKNRSALFGQMSEHPDMVSAYTLRVFDPETKQTIEAARLENGKMQTIPGKEALAEKAVMSSDESIDAEIAAIRDTVITEEYIAHFEDAYFDENSKQYATKNVAALREYIGKTLGEALDSKSK